MSDSRRPIPPNPPRWTPPTDAQSIEIPGIDVNASPNDQIDQIEQLITIKLQNIDENFSKIHNLLANKLLPAVKRYSVGTEPVREAAKFWTSFYEQAAQIRIPTFEDYSSMNETSADVEQDQEQETTMTQTSANHQRETDYTSDDDGSHQSAEQSLASTDLSFMPNQAAVSSTPATTHRSRMAHHNSSFASQASAEEPSWSASLESPLVRIDRELQKLSMDDPTALSMPSFSQTPSQLQIREPSMASRTDKGKGKEVPGSLLRNVLNHTLDTTGPVSPLKLRKPKTPIPKSYNPYLPPSAKPSDWNGVVDLNDPASRTPQRFRYAPRGDAATPDDDDDDSFDGLPPGMSPPRLMSPARPPRSAVKLGLGRTPIREAASRISHDIVTSTRLESAFSTGKGHDPYGRGGIESSMSTVPTPPSLSRYGARDTDSSMSIGGNASIESMMRRAGLAPQDSPDRSDPYPLSGSSEAYRYSQSPQDDDDASSFDMPVQLDEDIPQPLDDEGDSDSEDDEVNNTAHPSAAFLMASRGRGGDDSFDSSNHSGDSFDDDIGAEGAAVHPFAGAVVDDGFDDSFDDDSFAGGAVAPEETETVFGVPPMRRGAGPDDQEFRMLGEDLLQDTFTAQMRLPMGATESPTPANWPASNRN
ncbi:hypothetical protein ONZ45_g18554 [Pleurotus djamor]|nr:hypothetical protein ONZ45_g18554 [Pleurotus djamor]